MPPYLALVLTTYLRVLEPMPQVVEHGDQVPQLPLQSCRHAHVGPCHGFVHAHLKLLSSLKVTAGHVTIS